MTPFLLATFLALLAGGTLVVLFRENRALFRKVLPGVIGLAVLGVAYVAWVQSGSAHRGDPGLVRLDGATITEVAGSYRLSGHLANLATDLSITAVPVRLTVEECSASATGDPACKVLLDGSARVLVSIPPGESRPFVHVYPAAPHPAPRGELRWRAQSGEPNVYRTVAR